MDGIPTLSASYAMGGKGGTGQSAAEVTVTNNGLLVTGGDGAHGVLAQSIGAGGGNGGDFDHQLGRRRRRHAGLLWLR